MNWWQYINLLSYFVATLTVLAAVWFITRRFGTTPRIAVLLTIAVLAGAFMWSRQTSESEDGVIVRVAQLDEALSGSAPVALEFFSNF